MRCRADMSYKILSAYHNQADNPRTFHRKILSFFGIFCFFSTIFCLFFQLPDIIVVSYHLYPHLLNLNVCLTLLPYIPNNRPPVNLEIAEIFSVFAEVLFHLDRHTLFHI